MQTRVEVAQSRLGAVEYATWASESSTHLHLHSPKSSEPAEFHMKQTVVISGMAASMQMLYFLAV